MVEWTFFIHIQDPGNSAHFRFFPVKIPIFLPISNVPPIPPFPPVPPGRKIGMGGKSEWTENRNGRKIGKGGMGGKSKRAEKSEWAEKSEGVEKSEGAEWAESKAEKSERGGISRILDNTHIFNFNHRKIIYSMLDFSWQKQCLNRISLDNLTFDFHF